MSASSPASTSPSLPTDDIGPTALISIWTAFSLAVIFLSLRVYCKWTKHSRLFVDDIVLIAAWAALLAACIASTCAISYGLGKHFYMVPIENFNGMQLMSNISMTLSICAQCWSKVSFALTLMRIASKWMRYGLWFAIVSMNIFFCFGALTVWVNCVPLKKAWTPLMDGTCWDKHITVDFAIFVSAYSGVMDLCFVGLAWRVIMGLQMKKKERVGIAIAMSMVVFAAISAFTKCVFLPAVGSPNIVHDAANLVIWGTIEPAICIIAASIPVLRALVKNFIGSAGKYYIFRGRLFSSRLGGASHSNHNGQSGSGGRPSHSIRNFGDFYMMQGSEDTVQSAPIRDNFPQYSRSSEEMLTESLPVAVPGSAVLPKAVMRKSNNR